MRETLKRLIKLSAGYSLVTLIGPLFTLFLTPLYTRVLEPADYGVVDVALTLTGFLSTLAAFGMEGAVSAYFFNAEEQDRRSLVTTALIIVAFLSFVFSCGLFITAPYVSEIVFRQSEKALTLQIASIYIFSAPLYLLLSAILRLRMSVRRVNALGLTYLAALISLNLFFVLELRLQANGVVMANAAAMFIGSVVGIGLAFKPLRGRFSFSWAKTLARSGLMLLPASLGFLLLSNLDRLLLTQYVTQDQIGIYAIANKLASMHAVLFSAIWTAWWPMALQMAITEEGQGKIARMYELFISGSVLLSLALGLFSPEILRVYTREAYIPAAPYAAWLFFYMGPIGVTAAFFQTGLYAKRDIKHISIALILGVCGNIVFNLILDPLWGVWGATISTVLAGVIWAGYCIISGQQVMHLKIRWARVLTLLTITLIWLLCNTYGLLADVKIKMVVILLYIPLFFALDFISQREVRASLSYLKEKLFDR